MGIWNIYLYFFWLNYFSLVFLVLVLMCLPWGDFPYLCSSQGLGQFSYLLFETLRRSIRNSYSPCKTHTRCPALRGFLPQLVGMEKSQIHAIRENNTTNSHTYRQLQQALTSGSCFLSYHPYPSAFRGSSRSLQRGPRCLLRSRNWRLVRGHPPGSTADLGCSCFASVTCMQREMKHTYTKAGLARQANLQRTACHLK